MNDLVVTEDTQNPGEMLSARLLQELGKADGYLTPGKIQELWEEYRKHDVLFSDYTEGKVEPFLDLLLSSSSIWWEIFSLVEEKPIGVMCATRIIPHFEANGHFAIWSGKARGKEKLILETMRWLFDRYDLHRMTAEVAAYQRGVVRFVERLGFTREGEKREAVVKDGKWLGLELFGMTREELEEALNG